MTIHIIDYGSGNLHSVLKAFQKQAERHELQAELTSDPDRLASASHIVLPGVGAFGDCVAGLNAIDGMREALEESVIQQEKPFFGICVGMQMMLERGLEHGEHAGLGWIKGEVVPLFSGGDAVVRTAQQRPPPVLPQPSALADSMSAPALSTSHGEAKEGRAGDNIRIPHMGWNELTPTRELPLFHGLGVNPHVYFVHSFHAQCRDASDVLATTDYGQTITACIGKKNLLGTQFHPEKSGETGLKLIDHFITGQVGT